MYSGPVLGTILLGIRGVLSSETGGTAVLEGSRGFVLFGGHSRGFMSGRAVSRTITGDHIVNRTYGEHKNLYQVYLPFLLTIFGPINYGPP